MRQKWGLIRAVSVAILFSTVCVLNNGSRTIYTLLEIRGAGVTPVAEPAKAESAVDGLEQSKSDAEVTPETAPDAQTDVGADASVKRVIAE